VPFDWRVDKIQKAAGQGSTDRLTDLLTRRAGTGETTWDTGDVQRGLRLVSETRQNAGDGRDVRRGAHNPEVAGSNPAPATTGTASWWFRAGRHRPCKDVLFDGGAGQAISAGEQG
jgi:hypothetical protein